MKKRLPLLMTVFTLLICLACANLTLAGSKGAPTVIKVSNAVTEQHPMVTAMRNVFKKVVEEKTQGRYVVEIYHSGQLGDDIKAVESLHYGILEICTTSTPPLVGMVKEMAVFDIPFLFANEAVADYVLDGPVGKKLATALSKKGLVNLAWAESGFRNLTNSVKAVKTPEDLKGLKIRTMENKFHLAAWRALGANPTPMSFSEVFTALQQQAIDGEENPIAIIYTSKFYEVNRYITLTNHVYSPYAILYSKSLFDRLPAKDQKIIFAAARQAAVYERKLNRAANEKYLADMAKEGAVVTKLSSNQRKAFQELTQPIWDQVTKAVGADFVKEIKVQIKKAPQKY
jgi:tripartite ATP-independent transporter DctP family solute receptor